MSRFADDDSDQGRTRRHYAPDRDVDIQHIKIDVRPNFRERTVKGTTTILFAPIAKPLRELRLDAVDLEISDIRCDQPIADHVSDDDSLTIVFDPPLPAGKLVEVAIDHAAEPKQGMYFRTRELGYPEQDEHLWTQGEPEEARHWFPCFDYPNEKSTTEVVCRVPKDMTVLANGRLIREVVDEASGEKTVTWRQERPHASYLICLVVGHFKHLEKQHRDIPLRFFTQPSLFEHAANSFEDTEKIMAFYEEEIGVPYPWNKYDQVTILDFMWGGMENTTLTTLTSGTIFSRETENIRETRGLDAHEMAHQWFGDYVTCKDWSHLWLNEGFATYYTQLYEGHKFGRDAYLYGLYRSAKWEVLPRSGDPRPIVYKGYRSPAEQFDFRAYPKGSWVLHMLRSQLGEKLYRQCIRTYLERHGLQPVVTEDLRRVFEEITGEPWDQFFDQWVYHAGNPELRIRYRWLAADKLAEVTVDQTQDVDENTLLFSFPARLRFYVEGQDGPIDEELQVTDRTHTVHVPLAKQPRLVLFDPEMEVLASVEFSKSLPMLLDQLRDAPEVIARIQAAEALGRRPSRGVIRALKKALASDPFHGVRRSAATALARIGTDLAIQALLEEAEQSDARVRLGIVEELAGLYRQEVRQHLQDVVAEERNPAIVAAAIRGLAKYSTPAIQRQLRELLSRPSFRHEISVAAAGAIRSQNDDSQLSAIVDFLKQHESDLESRDRAFVLESLGQMGREVDDKSGLRELLLTNLENPRDVVKGGALRGLGALRDRSAAEAIRAFTQTGNRRLAQAAEESLRQLETTATTAPREVSELRTEVTKLKDDLEDLRREMRDLRSKSRPPGETSK